LQIRKKYENQKSPHECNVDIIAVLCYQAAMPLNATHQQHSKRK